MIRSQVTLAILCSMVLPCEAADIKVAQAEGKTAIVTVVGPIEPGDGARFALAVKGLGRAIVILNGRGGDPREGEVLGAEAGSRDMGTYVGAKADCTGACALAWLGGGRRYMERGARLGLAPGASDAYLRAAALPAGAVAYVRDAPSDGSRVIDLDGARRLGIPVVDAYAGKD